MMRTYLFSHQGGPPKAADGTLSFMIGAEHPSLEDESKRTPASYIKPTLSMMGDPGKLFYCDKLGAGAAAKISNNYLALVFELAIAEAMAIGVGNGIDAKLLHDVIQNSSGQSFMGDRNNPVPGVLPGAPASNGFQPGFRIPLCIKDLGLGVEAAKQVGIAPTMAEAALSVWKSAQEDSRCRDRDIAAIWLLLNDIKET
jgi:3-hydroxyisobutyrate dehydrogenase